VKEGERENGIGKDAAIKREATLSDGRDYRDER